MSSDYRAARPKPVCELLLVAVLFLLYKVGRQALAGDVSTAYANAAGIQPRTLDRAADLSA